MSNKCIQILNVGKTFWLPKAYTMLNNLFKAIVPASTFPAFAHFLNLISSNIKSKSNSIQKIF